MAAPVKKSNFIYLQSISLQKLQREPLCFIIYIMLNSRIAKKGYCYPISSCIMIVQARYRIARGLGSYTSRPVKTIVLCEYPIL